ncbi:MAG: sigma-54 dependent transcriptional regulator [Byssovorax sp.]
MAAAHESRILVIDDQIEMARLLGDQLADAGYVTELAAGGAQALELVRKKPFDLVICDLRMAEVDGLDVLDGVKSVAPFVPVIIMTAFGGIESAIEAIKRGAYHYLTKPFRLDEVLLFVERALGERRLRDENAALRRVAGADAGFAGMVGQSEKMRAVYALIERAASSPAPVLVRGESGTGKELVARALHFNGPRRNGPFIPLNCTTLPETLLESELFGQVAGSYTGASVARRGLFLEADGGTLFLDEVADMPAGLQSKFLRVLEDGEIRAVGSDVPRRVDVRVITSTNQDLEQRIREGRFRSDLFYRLAVVPISLPPLRERIEDLPALVEHFLAKARAKTPDAVVRQGTPRFMAALARASWPGNVRELENVIERLVVLSTSEVVDVVDLERCAPGGALDPSPLEEAKQRLVPLRQLESDYIAWVLSRCGGNKTRAAEILGIDVSTIYRRERSAAG